MPADDWSAAWRGDGAQSQGRAAADQATHVMFQQSRSRMAAATPGVLYSTVQGRALWQ
jgi:hypothetical protein